MYTDESLAGSLVAVGTGVLGVETLSAAAAVHGEFLVGKRVRVKRLKFHVTLAVAASTTAPVVRVLARPTPGSTSNQVVLGTLTIPNLAAVGSVYYKNIEPYEVPVGYSLALEQTVQAADASAAAGAGYYGLDLVIEQETVGNESKMIASA